MPSDTEFYVAIAVAFFGFMALAFILLFPIYRFMRREEERAEAWTRPALAERQRRAIERAERAAAAGDGAEAGGAGGDGTTGSAGGEGGPGEPPELRP
ncbi:MAG TPA: hypothetical protein VK002_14525 [Rubricoccaceae bacterium]|nr:hypothetical protein [Rubricoccaceae bacterium]